MDMVDLIVVVCSLTAGNACQENHMLFESRGSLAQCMIEAQPYMARWIGDHPDVQIKTWRCAWPDSEQQDPPEKAERAATSAAPAR